MPSCDSCNTTNQVEWCESCNRFMCMVCDNEIHGVSLPQFSQFKSQLNFNYGSLFLSNINPRLAIGNGDSVMMNMGFFYQEYLATFFSLWSTVPQIRKSLKTKKTDSYMNVMNQLSFFDFLNVNVHRWLSNGFEQKDIPLDGTLQGP